MHGKRPAGVGHSEQGRRTTERVDVCTHDGAPLAANIRCRCRFGGMYRIVSVCMHTVSWGRRGALCDDEGQTGKKVCRPDKHHITLCFCTSGGMHAHSALLDRHLLLEVLQVGATKL